MRLFHGTSVKNIQSIKDNGLISRFEGVYLTDSLESACRWIGFRLKVTGHTVMAVVEVEVDEKKLEEGMDHSPMMVSIFGVGKSMLSTKPIPKSRVKKIHYYTLT